MIQSTLTNDSTSATFTNGPITPHENGIRIDKSLMVEGEPYGFNVGGAVMVAVRNKGDVKIYAAPDLPQ